MMPWHSASCLSSNALPVSDRVEPHLLICFVQATSSKSSVLIAFGIAMKSSLVIAALGVLAMTPVTAAIDDICHNFIVNNIDYPGNDIMADGFKARTAEDCCLYCSTTAVCNAFTWTQYNGGTCYLKSTVSGAPVTRAPAPNGSAYMRSAITVRCAKLAIGVDFIGQDLGNVPGYSADMCCGHCRYRSGCTGFSWSKYNGGTCWLKGGVLTAIPKQGVTSARV